MRCMVLEVKVMSLAAGVMGVSKMEGDDDNSTINLHDDTTMMTRMRMRMNKMKTHSTSQLIQMMIQVVQHPFLK